MADKAIRVEGLDDLVRAFKVADARVAKDVRTAIEQAGEPIRQRASELVLAEISGMARSRVPWWTIRTGVERRTIGYIVPNQRGYKGGKGRERTRRPNLAPLIAEQEGIALDENIGRVVDEFEDALDEVAKAWARV